jgi:hypothetical protein
MGGFVGGRGGDWGWGGRSGYLDVLRSGGWRLLGRGGGGWRG